MDGEEYYTLGEHEKLVIGIKSSTLHTNYLLKKELTNTDKHTDGYLLTLSTEDTDLPQGKYYYDVALLRADGELVKIIGSTLLEIVESVVRSDVEC